MNIEQMIEENIGLVYHCLHKFGRAYDDDAISCAMEALWKAAMTYNSSKEVKFATYASVCILNAIRMYLRPMTNKRRLEVYSYDDPVFEEDTRLSFLPDNAYNPEDLRLRSEKIDILNESFDKVLNDCNITSRQVVEYWRDSDFTASQTEIANTLGISQSAVSRAISVFRNKLKKEMEDYMK